MDFWNIFEIGVCRGQLVRSGRRACHSRRVGGRKNSVYSDDRIRDSWLCGWLLLLLDGCLVLWWWGGWQGNRTERAGVRCSIRQSSYPVINSIMAVRPNLVGVSGSVTCFILVGLTEFSWPWIRLSIALRWKWMWQKGNSVVREESCEREPGDLPPHKVRRSTWLTFQHNGFELDLYRKKSLREQK
jgi:hypothetical protein